MAEMDAFPTDPGDHWADFNALVLDGGEAATGERDEGAAWEDGEAAEDVGGEGSGEDGEGEMEESKDKKPGWKEEQENKLKSILSSRRRSLPHGIVEPNEESAPSKPSRIQKSKSTGVDPRHRHRHQHHPSTPARKAKSRPSLSPTASRRLLSKSVRELSPPRGEEDGPRRRRQSLGVDSDKNSPTLQKAMRRPSLSPTASRRDFSRSRRELSPHGRDEGTTSTRKGKHTRMRSSDNPTGSRPTRRPSKGSSPTRKTSPTRTGKTPGRAKSMDDSFQRFHPSSPARQQRINNRHNKQEHMKRKASSRRIMVEESTAPSTNILDDDDSISWSRGTSKNSMDKPPSSPRSHRPNSDKRGQLHKVLSAKNQSSPRKLHTRSRSMDMSSPKVSNEIRHGKKPQSSRSQSMDMSANSLMDASEVSIDTTVASAYIEKKQSRPHATTDKKQPNRRDMRRKSVSEKSPSGLRRARSMDHSTSRIKSGIAALAGDEVIASVASKDQRPRRNSALMEDTSVRLEDLAITPDPASSTLGNSKRRNDHNHHNSHGDISRTKLALAALANNLSQPNMGVGREGRQRHHHHNKPRNDKHLPGRKGSSSPDHNNDNHPRRARSNSRERSLRNLDLKGVSSSGDDHRSKSPLNKHRSNRELNFRSSTGSTRR